MDAKYACERCYSRVTEKYEVEDFFYSFCWCEEEYDLDSCKYGHYEAPRTVYKCSFCSPAKQSYCLLHGMHKIKILKEKSSTTSTST